MPPAYEVLLLNTAIPQIQAAQSGDTYVVPRDIAFSTVANLANGTNLLPSLTFSSDTNTGIYREGADALGFTAGGGTNQMVLTTTGLGIGTSSPSVRLQLEQAANSAPVTLLRLNNSGTTGGGPGIASRILFTAGATVLGYVQGSNFASGAAGLQFSGDSINAQATLDSSGNLGLGVTPSANAGLRTLYVSGYNGNYSAIGLGASGGGYGCVGYNLGFTSTDGTIKALASDGMSWIRFQNGAFQFFQQSSATAGTNYTGTQAMTLDASGKLLVGTTTSPNQQTVIYRTSATTSNGALLLDGNGNYAGIQFAESGNLRASLAVDNSALYLTHESVLTFRTGSTANVGGTERARITSDGYFKASNNGTYQNSAAAYHELRQSASDWIAYVVNSNATPYGINLGHITDANSTGSPFLACNAGAALGTLRAEIRSNGGLANYQSNNVDLSDIRTKTDINPVASYWSKIAALEIVSYKYKDQTHNDLNIGVIAQQVEQVAPEFVDADGFGETPEDGVPLKTIYNKDLTFAAIKALQEAMARIEQLEAKVAALETK